jgi:hypothetical protein
MNGSSSPLVCRLLALCVFGLSLLGAAGCGSKGTLHGKATFKNQPLPKGTRIVFLHEKSERSYMADVKDDEGNYESGPIQPGEMLIAIQLAGAPKTSAGPMGDKMASGKQKTFGPSDADPDVIKPPPGFGGVFNQNSDARNTVAIPRKYTEPKESGLKVTVTGGKQEFNITIPDQ